MKRLLIASVFLFALQGVSAGTLSTQVFTATRIADDDMFQVGGWHGIQFSYQPDNTLSYSFISYEKLAVYPKGKAFDYTMLGLGVGSKYKLTKNIKLFGQVGYYFVKNSFGKRKSKFNEGIYYYLNDRYIHSGGGNYYSFDEYEVENDNTYGGTIGIEMNYPITKKLSADFVFSYRIMTIKESVRGFRKAWDAACYPCWWEFGVNRNYSSTNFGVNMNYQF